MRLPVEDVQPRSVTPGCGLLVHFVIKQAGADVLPTMFAMQLPSSQGERALVLSEAQPSTSIQMQAKIYGGAVNSCEAATPKPKPCLRMMGKSR